VPQRVSARVRGKWGVPRHACEIPARPYCLLKPGRQRGGTRQGELPRLPWLLPDGLLQSCTSNRCRPEGWFDHSGRERVTAFGFSRTVAGVLDAVTPSAVLCSATREQPVRAAGPAPVSPGSGTGYSSQKRLQSVNNHPARPGIEQPDPRLGLWLGTSHQSPQDTVDGPGPKRNHMSTKAFGRFR
jgi:hypothetical protein